MVRKPRVLEGSDRKDESPKDGLSNGQERMAEKRSKRPVLMELVFTMYLAGANSDFLSISLSFPFGVHTGWLLRGLASSGCKYGVLPSLSSSALSS